MNLLNRIIALLCLALILDCVWPAMAQNVPATSPARQLLEATITAVQGKVQVRADENKPWERATKGMVIGEKAEFRTGPKSAVQFVIPPDQTITLDRLGTVKLLQAVQESGKVKTDLGMEYGRLRYDVDSAGLEHESVISSPSVALAVRGTRVSLYDQRPFKAEAVSLTGRAEFREGKKRIPFGNKGQGKTKVKVDQPDAAAVAMVQSVIDPGVALARTDAEAELVNVLLSRGSVVVSDRDVGIKVVRGGVPPTDAQLVPALPGRLNFVLRWSTNANLDMGVSSPGGTNNGGEYLYPVGALASSANGGVVAWDHQGGPNGGIEVTYWKDSFPTGLYGVGIFLIDGKPTLARLDVFLDGKHVPIFDGQTVVETVVVPVLPPIRGIGEGTLGGIVPIGTKLPQTGSRVSAQPRPTPKPSGGVTKVPGRSSPAKGR